MVKLLVTLVATSVLQRFGDLIVGGIVLALVAYGAQNGLFLAVLAGMHALASLVVALAFAEPLAALLVSFELPAIYAFPAAFGLLLIGTAVAIRMAVGGYVPAEVVRFAPMIDKLGGGLMGAVAGIIVAGTVLIACSILPVPEAFRIDGSKLGYDMGTRMLRTFARCVEPDEAKRAILLDGEPGTVPEPVPEPRQSDDAKDESSGQDSSRKKREKPHDEGSQSKPEPPAPPPVPHWSEPFADLNGNKSHDEGEPYLDTDKDKAFTPKLILNDPNGNTKRDVGLLERYRMHAWGHHVISVVAIDEVIDVPPAEPAAPSDAAAPAAEPATAPAKK
jgi:uncharacterized membrane protein required for colicin V production